MRCKRRPVQRSGAADMGELISLAERRAVRGEAHAPPLRPRVSFAFDLASPWTYLAAERVDQRFADVRWVPAIGDALPGGRDAAAHREAVQERAEELRIPSCGPSLGLSESLRAAGELRRDAPLEQAALRLLSQGADAMPVLVVGPALFCGEPRLAEAAAAAGGRGVTRPRARRSLRG
jgi:hypothetical protein